MNDAPTLNLREIELDREVGLLLPESLARKVSGICLGRVDEHLLTLVVADPSEVSIYDLVEMATDHRYKAQLLGGDISDIELAQEWIYRVADSRRSETWKSWLETKKFSGQSVNLNQNRTSSSVEVNGLAVERAEKYLVEGISAGASDIHLETYETGLVVRYRQDGVLRIIDECTDLELADAIVKRLKIMAQMDITQSRVTQGGRISLDIGGRGFDLRVSILPVPAGQSVVLRVLNKGSFSVTLNDLGLPSAQLERYQWFINHPHGLILTCGPTGAGKSTTLYASLKSIQRPDRKLLTIEDPIEYQMPGIIQVQVNTAPKESERRVTFASAMREFLRHDPDVILVGEIRDEETAHISVQAALTGHLVLSTIHTNDSVGIINRLRDQGIKPYLIASTLIGGVAQRLVRRICNNCSQPFQPSEMQKRRLEKHALPDQELRQGKGCDQCRHTGFKGRIGLYEILTVTDEIRDLVERDGTALQISQTARQQGMLSLLEDGLAKAAAGLVSLDEVERVCMMDLA